MSHKQVIALLLGRQEKVYELAGLGEQEPGLLTKVRHDAPEGFFRVPYRLVEYVDGDCLPMLIRLADGRLAVKISSGPGYLTEAAYAVEEPIDVGTPVQNPFDVPPWEKT